MPNYEAMAGERIEDTIDNMISWAKESNDAVSTEFNGISLLVTKESVPADVLTVYQQLLEKQHEVYKKTDQYKEQKKRDAASKAKKEADVESLLEDLKSLDFCNLSEVMNWLLLMQSPSDDVRAYVSSGYILNVFTENGFGVNVNCGDEFVEGDEDNHARWIIGQALGGLQSIGAIHPMIHSFASSWKKRFKTDEV